jgi:hypothetical protein
VSFQADGISQALLVRQAASGDSYYFPKSKSGMITRGGKLNLIGL